MQSTRYINIICDGKFLAIRIITVISLDYKNEYQRRFVAGDYTKRAINEAKRFYHSILSIEPNTLMLIIIWVYSKGCWEYRAISQAF